VTSAIAEMIICRWDISTSQLRQKRKLSQSLAGQATREGEEGMTDISGGVSGYSWFEERRGDGCVTHCRYLCYCNHYTRCYHLLDSGDQLLSSHHCVTAYSLGMVSLQLIRAGGRAALLTC